MSAGLTVEERLWPRGSPIPGCCEPDHEPRQNRRVCVARGPRGPRRSLLVAAANLLVLINCQSASRCSDLPQKRLASFFPRSRPAALQNVQGHIAVGIAADACVASRQPALRWTLWRRVQSHQHH